MNNKIKKSVSAGLIICTLLLLATFTSCGGEKIKDINVVLIVIDTVRSDHLPFYGYKKNTAPFLDKLSKESVVFERAYAASSWTSPATASIFTSLYPFQHRLLMGLLAIRMAKQIDPNVIIHKIPEEIDTIAEIMKKAGFNTYAVTDNLNIGERQGFTQGFDKFENYMYNKAPAVNDRVKKWQKEMETKGKYFLYLHYMDPHAPYHRRAPWYVAQDERQADLIAAHDSEINYVDQHIEELYKQFKWDKNTLLIITADHGEGLWDHGKMGHGNSLYREEIQVPLMIRLPGEQVTRRVKVPVCTIDILPTVRDIVGLGKDKNNEGISLVPHIEGKEEDYKDRYLFSYLWKQVKKEVEFKSTLHDKYQFIFQKPKKKELFNLLGDPKETHNLFFKGGFKMAELLEDKFNDFMKKARKYKQQDTKVKLDKEKLDKLKSLGYIDNSN